MAIFKRNWGGLTEENQKFQDEMFERFVPWSGKANTLGGEILRAINRIVYRFYNDGDTVHRYYGSELNYSAACDNFLIKSVPNYDSLAKYEDDYHFELAASKNFNKIVEYLRENPSLFEIANTEDCLANAPKSEWDYDEDEDENEEEEDW